MSASTEDGTASAAGLPIANRTTSGDCLCSNDVLESMTDPTSPAARAAYGGGGRGWVCTVLPPDRGFVRQVGQSFHPGCADHDRLGQFVAPAVHPHPENDVERHAGLQLGRLLAAQAHGALTPVRGIADADRVPDPRILSQTVRPDHPVERLVHGAAGDT